MAKTFALVYLICLTAIPAISQTPSDDHAPLFRRYREGETLTYHMKGTNEDWHYEIQADGIVKKATTGHYFEEFRWSHLVSDGREISLSPDSADFRQELSLDRALTAPNLARVDPRLVGPITDLLTFYVDLWVATKTGRLVRDGDHLYFKGDRTGSWADGNYILTGEDSVDFDMTLEDISHSSNTATLLVRHVPPEEPKVRLVANWMRKPVSDTPNNWVQVRKMASGKFLAAVGKETFDVQMKVSLTDGKILSGTLDNPLETIERECEDAGLTKCGDPHPQNIHRQIEISLER